MHRVLAALLASLFSFLLIAPAVSPDASSQLPACCRAKGKHHCALRTAAARESSPGIAQRCPLSPKLGARLSAARIDVPLARWVCFASILSHPTLSAQTAALWRISFSRSRQKRGPPSLLVFA